MKPNSANWKWAAAGLLSLAAVTPLRADTASDSSPEISQLKKQIEELDQKIRILERNREIDRDVASDAAKNAPRLSIGQDGVSFSSSDSNFVAQLHAVIQADSRTYFKDGGNNGNDGFLLRRARPIFSGTVYHRFDFMFIPDFGGSAPQIQDAYVNFRFFPELQLQAGKFKAPVGLEQLQAEQNGLFNERSLVTDLVPNRDLGVELRGDLFDGRITYAAGIFNGTPDYSSSTTNSSFSDFKSYDGRVFFQPWRNSTTDALRGLGFGLGGNYQADHPNANAGTGLTPGYTTDGQQKFFTYKSGVTGDGPLWRLSPQAYYYYGPFGLMAEYAISDQTVAAAGGTPVALHNTAWEINGSWVLTGDDASYNGVTPLHPFDPLNGHWGAFQIGARYAELSVDPNAFTADGGALADNARYASGAKAWGLTLNWYLNKDVRINLGYSHTTFSGYGGSSPNGANAAAQSENVLFTRMQLAF